jgi:hypothetical protein
VECHECLEVGERRVGPPFCRNRAKVADPVDDARDHAQGADLDRKEWAPDESGKVADRAAEDHVGHEPVEDGSRHEDQVASHQARNHDEDSGGPAESNIQHAHSDLREADHDQRKQRWHRGHGELDHGPDGCPTAASFTASFTCCTRASLSLARATWSPLGIGLGESNEHCRLAQKRILHHASGSP